MIASLQSGPVALLALLNHEDANAAEARGWFYQLSRSRIIAQQPFRVSEWTETPAERAVVAGWRHLGASGWEALRAEEDALAAIPLAHPLGADARWLRAAWRAQVGDAREAGALLDDLIARGADRVEWYLTRAQAHAREGDATAALGAITEMMIASGNRELAPIWQRSAAELLRGLAVAPEWEEWRASLVAVLGS
jgi:hypothetical protein